MSAIAEPVVVCSVLEKDVAATMAAVRAAPSECGLVEVRADRLRADDVAAIVGRAGRELIVTARRIEDGGGFDGSEEERRAIVQAALDAGSRWVDVEHGGALAELAEGQAAGRTILSHHEEPCRAAALVGRLAAMAGSRAARLKIVPRAERPEEIAALRDLLADARGRGRLAAFALGRAGTLSRLLAPSWGSWATYGSTGAGRETAAGQPSARDLVETYAVATISARTRLFALLGSRVLGSPSPAMHAAAFRESGIDARYVPLEIDDLGALDRLLASGATRFEGFAVTMPLKEAAAARCATLDEVGRHAAAVNTVVVRDGAWHGSNTDGPAALELVRRHLDPRGARVAVLGAGGTARALGYVLVRAGAEVRFYNRNEQRARDAARAVGAAGADSLAAAGRVDADVLINATPLGAAGEQALPGGLQGARLVLDAVYSAAPTPLVAEARSRGVEAVEGFELLVAQALLQFERLAGVRPGRAVLESAGRAWLAGRAG